MLNTSNILVALSTQKFISFWYRHIIQSWFKLLIVLNSSICCCSVAQLCLTLYNPMDCSTPGFPVLHHLLELAQTHVHWVGDAIQPHPSHPLSSPSPPAFSLFYHQNLFQRACSSHQLARSIRASASAPVLPVNIQDWFPLVLTGLISSQFKGLSRVFSNTTVQRQQLFGTPPFYCLALISVHGLKNYSSDYMDLCRQSNVSAF